MGPLALFGSPITSHRSVFVLRYSRFSVVGSRFVVLAEGMPWSQDTMQIVSS
jgi:hypothetical protein